MRKENIKSVEVKFGEQKSILFETGWLAKQASSSVIARCKGTVVLASVTYSKPVEDSGMLSEGVVPLTVEYREKYSAAGKFPGGFIKREGRPSVREILTCRLIDRPIRPLLPQWLANEIQITVFVLSADEYHDPDILAMNASALAMLLSGLPLRQPVGSVKVGLIDNEFIINPTYQELIRSELELIVSATKDGVIMIESGSNQISEDRILEAISFAQKHIGSIIDAQQRLLKLCGGVSKRDDIIIKEVPEELYTKIRQKYITKLRDSMFVEGKLERSRAMDQTKQLIQHEFCPKNEAGEPIIDAKTEFEINACFNKLAEEILCSEALEGSRCDGRKLDEIREVSFMTDILPIPHGSALFARGETQALVSVTLGTKEDAQIIDGLTEYSSQRFMLHYNHPPFSTGEVRPIRGPGRREIGHGALAERALLFLIPDESDFPYTIRVVSDILESNGSTSMASVCGATLALLDAGVKLQEYAAGISMGLVKEDDRYCILTDIMGLEDHYGDMDFKVAGTENGITALQLDIKTDYLDFKILQEAIHKAKKARLEILKKMKQEVPHARPELKPHAPKISKVPLQPEKIGLVIGQGGRTIREIETKTGAVIHIGDDNICYISHKDPQKLQEAITWVNIITEDLKIGNPYKVRVTNVKPFGAIVEVIPTGHPGMIHVSEISDRYIESIEDFVKVGQVVEVVLKEIDEFGRYRFSIKKVGMTPEQIIAQVKKPVKQKPRKFKKKSREKFDVIRAERKFTRGEKPFGKDTKPLP
jgi:polyribonucleotide nucleotidyltransferase